MHEDVYKFVENRPRPDINNGKAAPSACRGPEGGAPS